MVCEDVPWTRGRRGGTARVLRQLYYPGIFGVLLLGSLGVPIPEEMPIIAAAVLSHEGVVRSWLALPVCLLGVLSGDMVLYGVGRHWGQQVLDRPWVRLVLSPARKQWLQAAYRRHALKTVVTARHVLGLRAAAFLIAGSARVPSRIRARVEHPIGVIKRVFGFTKVCYRGLVKNRHRLVVACALANLFMVRKRLLHLQAA